MSIRLSYTAMTKYKESPKKYYLHYMLGLREERVGSALPFGNAIDEGLNTLLLTKDLEKARDAFLSQFQTFDWNGEKVELATANCIKWSKADLAPEILLEADSAEIKTGANPSWVSLKRKGEMILEAYREQVLPHFSEVLAVQKYVQIQSDENAMIQGYVDLIARFQLDPTVENPNLLLSEWNGKILIVDNKTSSLKYKEDSVKTSEQLGTYMEVDSYEYEVDAAAYIVIPKNFRKKKEPLIPIEIIIDEVSPETLEKVFSDYEKVLNGVKLGDFPCTKQCLNSPFGCAYKRYCDSNGEDLTGLVYVKENKDGTKEKTGTKKKSDNCKA